uniref:Bet v I/Major latex protein domain-containing protein n=1 Tax=Leersia perrieri TaxID=77586 RepID=A0A0D9Y076_9ORYZ
MNPSSCGMAPACVSDEHAVAVSAERLWKVFMDASAMPKVCAALVNDIAVEGDGTPGTIYTMKLNSGSIYKTRVAVCDSATHVLKSDVLEVESKVEKLKSHSIETKLETNGDCSCVAKLKVEYELEDGSSLVPEKEKMLIDGYYGMLKMVEEYLVAHPMAPATVSSEQAVAASAERLWKALLDVPAMPKICAGFIDGVEVEGNGEPGTIHTLKLNPVAGVGSSFKTKLVACDNATLLVKSEVLEAESKVGKLKSHFKETKVESTGDNSCMVKLKVEYELEDGSSLSPEKEKMFAEGYFGVLKMIEAYLIAHPEEYA